MRSHITSQTNPSAPENTKDQRQPKAMAIQGITRAAKRASYAGAAVEDGHGNAALLAGKPLRHRLAGARPVEAFSNPQQKSKSREAGNRTRETGKDVHHRPEATARASPSRVPTASRKIPPSSQVIA